MARTKWISKPRPLQPAQRDAPQETAKRAAWTAAIELGASNGQAMVKKPGGEWELVRWAQGVSASSVGGAEAIPALTAIRKQGEPYEILHGHAAVRARKRNPGDWEMFAYPKLVFIDKGTTPDVQRTLELQKEKAKAFGMTSKEVAVAFFRHMISEVVGQRDESFEIYMNISDRWPNSNVQDLMLSLQGLRTNAQFEHVDECLSSIIGRISSSAGSVSAGGVYVVVDCGHSGMNVGLAEVADGPIYKVHQYKEYPAGAGEINMAVEDAVRSINRTNGAKSADTNVWEVSECIDEYFKPEPEAEISPQCGLSDDEWEMVMGRANLANRNLDKRRPNLTRPILTEGLDLANRLANDVGLHVLLTGRGARSPTSQKAFQSLISRDFTMATLHDDKENHITAVLAGLTRIADDPGILSVKEVPVSLWLRSDPDETKDEENRNTVVRICTQGQDMKDTVNVRDRVSASHPVHYELCAADDKPPSLDLSVFGTPAGVSDEQIIEGWNDENFAYTDVGKVTEFGRFEQELPDSTVTPSKKECHVYLYVKVSRLSVELYAIFANDGRAVKPLERTPFEKAFQNGELATKWKQYQGVHLSIVRLKQVARPESLSTIPREPPVSTSKQSEPPVDDDSPSNVIPAPPNEIQVSQKRKRTSLPQVQQGKESRLLPKNRKLPQNEDQLDLRSKGDSETESEMEM